MNLSRLNVYKITAAENFITRFTRLFDLLPVKPNNLGPFCDILGWVTGHTTCYIPDILLFHFTIPKIGQAGLLYHQGYLLSCNRYFLYSFIRIAKCLQKIILLKLEIFRPMWIVPLDLGDNVYRMVMLNKKTQLICTWEVCSVKFYF